MKIVIGLGNPGLRYRKTRHNIGFSVLEMLAKKHQIKIRKKGFSGIYGIGSVNGKETFIFEPRTYMNLSGEAVKAVCSAKLDDPDDLLVISDDFNLEIGKIRLRRKGSAGGHNGLRSVIDNVGEDFNRLRIGIAPKEVILGDTSSFVLTKFSKKELTELKEPIEKAVECIESWLDTDIKEVMGKFN